MKNSRLLLLLHGRENHLKAFSVFAFLYFAITLPIPPFLTFIGEIFFLY